MKRFICFGDVHFSSINPWNFEAGEHFIEWFKSHDFGDPNEVEFGFVGDIAERDTNPGNVVDQIDRLFSLCSQKGKHTYIAIGNHDKKLYHDIEQHSLVFLAKYKNISVLEKETVVNTDNGFKVLFLPWQRILGQNINDYYDSLGEEWTSPHYDIIVGHWQIKSEDGPNWKREGVDISRFDVTCKCIGHIHNRIRDEYIGSIFPNNIDEYDPSHSRGYKVLNEDRVETYEELPDFLKYETLEFGETPAEPTKDCAVVYTVKNCVSELEAQEKYPNIFIRGIERETLFGKDSVNVSTDAISNLQVTDPFAAFEEMIKEMGLQVNRTVYSDIKAILKPTA